MFAPAIQRHQVKARDETEQKPEKNHAQEPQRIGYVEDTRSRRIILLVFSGGVSRLDLHDLQRENSPKRILTSNF